MGGLASRLMEAVGRGVTLVHAGRAPTLSPAAPKSARLRAKACGGEPEAIPDRERRKFHAAPAVARGRLKNGNPSGDYLRAPRCGAHSLQ